jgi:hypothetical protein
MKHTPGPWASSDVGVVQAETGELICAAVYEDGEAYSNARANMRLVATAPELLVALKMLHDETAEYTRLNNLGDPHHNRSMQMARDAIWKAEND